MTTHFFKSQLTTQLKRSAANCLMILPLIMCLFVAQTLAQSSAFTYQGALRDNGVPANGAFDLQFKLFDAVSGGAQVGATATLEDVAVSGGIFTVTLDFGANAFNGTSRWLEISVRPGASTSAFNLLTPRQPVTATPYAVRSLSSATADTATTATNAVNFSGTLNGDVTGTQGATSVVRLQGQSVASNPPANGQVLKFNSATNKWEPAADANSGGTITGVTAGTGLNGGGTSGTVVVGINAGGVTTIELANSAVTNANLANNAVTASKIAAGHVVKSLNALTDNVALAGGTNITVTPTGNALTIAAPNVLTSVTRDATLAGDGTSGNPLGVSVPLSLSGTPVTSVVTANNSGSGDAVTGISANGYAGKFTGRTQTSFNNTGLTTTDLITSEATTTATFDTSATALTNTTGAFANTATRSAGANLLTNIALYATASGAQNNYAAIFNAGNVGIGTTAPTSKLHVVGDTNLAGNLTFSGLLNGSGANLTSLNASNITSGVLADINGGTGLSSPGASGNYLRSNGTTWTSSAIQAVDVPAGSTFYIQNQNAGAQASANFNISGNGTAGGTLSSNIVNATARYNLNGARMLSSDSSLQSVHLGFQAGQVNTANSSTFVGWRAGLVNTSGSQNTFVGGEAGASNVTGTFNSFFGYAAGGANTGNGNSYFGRVAGSNTTLGEGNVAVGMSAGSSISIGQNNTLLGTNSDLGAGNLLNASAIGSKSHVNCSNCLVLGSINGVNNATATVNVGIGTNAPTERLEVNGNLKLASGNAVKFADGTNISGAITATQLANDAVTSTKILDANITTAKLADATVTTAKLADASVTSAKLAAPLALSGSVAGSGIFTATNTSTAGGKAIVGIASAAGANTGVHGESVSTTGFGVYGKNISGGSAGYFEGLVSITGVTRINDTFFSCCSPQLSVVAEINRNTAIKGTFGANTFGALGDVSGGVWGRYTHAADQGNGVYGITDSSGAGGGAGGSAAIRGVANSTVANGLRYGVYGEASTASATSYAGYFNGNVNLTGNLNGAWRTQANATSPNIIGGYFSNAITAGVAGGVIGGGGSFNATNVVTDDYGTVSGGVNNRAGNNAGTVFDVGAATVGGGTSNVASGSASTVGGGSQNVASGNNSTIAGGQVNAASSSGTTIGGGNGNMASGSYSTISGGFTNTASNTYGAVGGGISNVASAVQSVVAGGGANTASGVNSMVPGGAGAIARHTGELAFANGGFNGNTPGTAQTSFYNKYVQTSDATPTELFLDGGAGGASSGTTNRLTVAAKRSVTFDIMLVAETDATATYQTTAFRLDGIIARTDVGNVRLYGGTVTAIGGGGDLPIPVGNINVTTDTTNQSLKITVTGLAATNIRWVASVRAVEVQW